MTSHSIAQAKTHLSRLIDKAIEGETVVITRHGHPVAEIRPVARQGQPMTAADVEWLRERRLSRMVADFDPGSFVSEMRDEDDERLFRR